MQLGSLRIKKTFSNMTEVSLCMRIGLLYPKRVFFLDMFWEYSEINIYFIISFLFNLPAPYSPSLLPII